MCVLREPLGERLPVAGTNTLVVHHHVVVEESDGGGHREIISHECEERTVSPGAVSPVSLPPRALAQEADTLCVSLRTLVEAVDLELEPVVTEILK